MDVDREVGLSVMFEDGHLCFFAVDDLRDNCPCATCREVRDRGEEVWSGEGARIVDASLVGAWGINFTWEDGHGTGIFPWEGLRAWCDRERS